MKHFPMVAILYINESMAYVRELIIRFVYDDLFKAIKCIVHFTWIHFRLYQWFSTEVSMTLPYEIFLSKLVRHKPVKFVQNKTF